MDWTELPRLGFDTETTGVDVLRDRLVTAALTSGTVTTNWLADPGIDIPEGASAVHGISTEKARTEGRDAAEVLDEVADALVGQWRSGGPVVVFNAPFDLSLMEAELSRHGMETLRQRLDGVKPFVIDPLVIDRTLDRWRKGRRTLTAMTHVYGVAERADAHNADADVAMMLQVLDAQLARWPKLVAMAPLELTDYQSRAHGAWASSFEKYLRKSNPKATVGRGWPFQTSCQPL